MRAIGTLVVLFLLMGAFFIISTQNVYVTTAAGRSVFVQAYLDWLQHLAMNVKSITGAVIQSRWMP